MSIVIALSILTIANFWFFKRRTLRYLRFFQQEQYLSERFQGWLKKNRAFDTRGSFIAILAAVLCFFSSGGQHFGQLIISFFAASALILLAALEEDPRLVGKLPLVMTERANRINNTSLALYALLLGLLLITVFSFILSISPDKGLAFLWLAQIPLFQSTPYWLLLSNRLLKPAESRLQNQYLEEAKTILKQLKPLVVGITGSYGKTSTKAALGELLATAVGPVFWPQKGVNSLMGITREIRERLRPGQQFAVIEMGAFTRGSIARLCALTPPQAGIITAIGEMHLDRFGSEDNIYLAKSELAQAIPENGILVCNGDNAGARRCAQEYPKKTTLLYGFDTDKGGLDAWISDLKVGDEGSSFTLHWQGRAYPGKTKLLGRPALSNLLASFTMAAALGGEPEFLMACLSNIEPVENRLHLSKENGVVYLNDAYNSNPIGFSSALDVLTDYPGRRKILMTPGMIELGERQRSENEIIGKKAAACCDLVVVVGEINKEALVSGFCSAGFGKDKLLTVSDRTSAFSTLANVKQSGDVILIENDLPDLYEGNVRF